MIFVATPGTRPRHGGAIDHPFGLARMFSMWLRTALLLACRCAAEYVPIDELETEDFLAGPKRRKQEFLDRMNQERKAAYAAQRVRQALNEGCELRGTLPCGLGRLLIFKKVRLPASSSLGTSAPAKSARAPHTCSS